MMQGKSFLSLFGGVTERVRHVAKLEVVDSSFRKTNFAGAAFVAELPCLQPR